MPYTTKVDYVTRASKDFKAQIRDQADKIGKLQDRVGIQKGRPFNHLESNSVCILFGIGEFMDVCRDTMGRRLRDIPNGAQRVGIIQWAARSLFEDCIKTLDKTAAVRYSEYASKARLECITKRVVALPDYTRTVWDEDLSEVAEAAYKGTCQMCSKRGTEAKQCKLKKALDHMNILNPSDDPDCWYKDGV